VWTDGDRAEVRELVQQMEHLRQVVFGVTFSGMPDGRTLVFALRDDDELAAFSSTEQPRAYALMAGIPLWQPAIVLSARSQIQDSERTVAHELTHVISFAAVHYQPRWLAEGMANFFQTLPLDVDRGTADVGVPPAIRGQPMRMRMADLLPVEQLFAWREMTAHEEREYSTAWLLVTYLIGGTGENGTWNCLLAKLSISASAFVIASAIRGGSAKALKPPESRLAHRIPAEAQIAATSVREAVESEESFGCGRAGRPSRRGAARLGWRRRETRRRACSIAGDSDDLRSGYAMFLFAKSQLTMFQNASMNLGRALR
jgi:hypothetical protein